MTIHQQLRVTRLCKPTKECDGLLCLMIAKKSSPTIQGRKSFNNFTILNVGLIYIRKYNQQLQEHHHQHRWELQLGTADAPQ